MPRSEPATAAALRMSQECIAMRIRRVNRVVTRIFEQALRPHGVSTAQLNLLVAIARAGPLRPFELARHLELEKSTVARNLDRMLSHRWIRATPEPDGNGYRVAVEPPGRALLERAFPAWEQAQARAMRHVGKALASAVRGLDSGGP